MLVTLKGVRINMRCRLRCTRKRDLVTVHPRGNLNLQSRWPIFIVGNYLGGILAFGADIGHENNRFSHESYPKVTKWETWNPMQVNQSALVGEYVADHICGFICYLVRHVTLGNMLFSFITCNAAIWNSYGYISVFWNILQFSPD